MKYNTYENHERKVIEVQCKIRRRGSKQWTTVKKNLNHIMEAVDFLTESGKPQIYHYRVMVVKHSTEIIPWP